MDPCEKDKKNGVTDETVSCDDIIKPLRGMRKVIARRMRESLDTAAQTSHVIAVDMSEVIRLKNGLKGNGIAVSYNTIILKAVASTLERHPMMNSRLVESEIIMYKRIHIGIAVTLDRGLLVPVIRDVNDKGLEAIEMESRDLATRVRSGKATPEDLSGATFTVSNLGKYELDSFTAIINPPESGILAVGVIKDEPVVLEGGNIGVRPICKLTLTYDHRVIDGAPAAEFLRDIKTELENSGRLL